MNLDSVTSLIVEYRYWILIPLSIIEGPIVAFAAGTLASLGYFNVFWLAIFFLIRDLVMDGLYYALGHFGGRTALVRRLLKKIGVRSEHLDDIKALWGRRAFLTMFFGKLSYGIASSFIVVAGTVGMPLRIFFGWGAVVAILQYGVLLAFGFFFGVSLGGKADVLIKDFEYVVAGITVIGILYYVLSRYARGRIMKK